MSNKGTPEQHTQLEVKIMGRLFRMACQPEERAALAKAVHMLESKMQSIRNSGRVVGLDNMAILAALQIAHESLVGSNQGQPQDQPVLGLDNEALGRKIESIQAQAEQGLALVQAPPEVKTSAKAPVQQAQLFE